MVVGSCWLFQTLALLDIPALYYIGMVFAIIQGRYYTSGLRRPSRS
jgi:hypothetical protein